MRKKIILAAILIVLAAGGYFLFYKKDSKGPFATVKSNNGKSGPAELSDADASKYTINNQNSIYFIVNKQRALPGAFVPQNLVAIGSEQLRSDTADAINGLVDAARNDGVNLKIISGYRSYNYQVGVYNDYVKKDGQAKADTYSARPGHSEHQTGLAADLGTGTCDLQICFGETRAGKWLAANSYKYGFIIRYQKGKESLTGYQYEPWHVRYLGADLAGKVYKSGKTLEQYFGLPAATSY